MTGGFMSPAGTRRIGLAVPSVIAAAVFLWGGYVEGWSWTGLSADVHLWDWFSALALPVTVGLLPVLLLHRHRLRAGHRLLLLGVLAGFVCLVLAGYLVPLEWTGFTGNTLWDWLELALLPVVLATAALWPAPDELRRGEWALIGLGATAFLVVVLAGYLVPWEWTGFSDNKGWDWLKLLLLPVLVPTVVLPLLQRVLHEEVVDSPAEAASQQVADARGPVTSLMEPPSAES
jgi:hypothetical protein